MNDRDRREGCGFINTIGFLFLAIVAAIVVYIRLDQRTEWSPYLIWLAAVNVVTFAVYGVDKLLSTIFGRPFFRRRNLWVRATEYVLNLLALAGGFVGGWLGMFFFKHKRNRQKHKGIWETLSLAPLLHGVVFLLLVLMGIGV